MENSFSMHEVNGAKDLEHIEFDFLVGESGFFTFEALVQIHIHKLEYKCKFA